jgi:opacity protein-like surface antigen
MCSRRRSQLGHSVWRKFGAPAVFLAFGVLAAVPALSRAEDSCDSFLSCCDQGSNCRQFYLSGIVGADFATFDKVSGNPTTVPNQSIFTGGAAAGVRYLRDNGALRLEFEGRGRDQVSATSGDAVDNITTRATDGWSAMVNVWRDYKPYDSFGLYAGGGIGAGGYRWTTGGNGIGSLVSGNDRISNFAWQAGGGLFYEISKRATVDLGYRFFSISESTAEFSFIGLPATAPTNFAASELLLQLRIYEPFRGWRR